jgi:hypothetical protein
MREIRRSAVPTYLIWTQIQHIKRVHCHVQCIGDSFIVTQKTATFLSFSKLINARGLFIHEIPQAF